MKTAELKKALKTKIAALAATLETLAENHAPSHQDALLAARLDGEQAALLSALDFINGGTWGRIYFTPRPPQ